MTTHLKILDWQLRRFEAPLLAELVRRTAARVRRSWPERCAALSDGELGERLNRAVTDARSYGLRSEREVGAFVDLSLLYGSGFHRHPSVGAILTDRSIDAVARIDRIFDLLGEPPARMEETR